MPDERVAVVDDEPVILRVVADALRASGYEVARFDQPAAALQHLEIHTVDLVVTDISMPTMSGLDLLRRIRSIDPNLVVVMVTGKATLDVALEALDLGAQAVPLKPFTPSELRRAIHGGLR